MTLAPPIKAALATTLLILSAVVSFGPILPEDGRGLVGYALLVVSLLVSNSPKQTVDGVPTPVVWQDRDAGQKLSIIMFHLLILALAAALAWSVTTQIDGWIGPVIGALAITTAIWLTLRNWKNRNAR